MKLVLKVILVVFILFVVISGGGLFFLSRGLEAGSTVMVGDVDLSQISDGTYTGKYQAGRWTNEVTVEVKDHRILSISVVKDVTFSKPEVKAELLGKVVQNQQVNVDVIAGSTITCKAYLKAIEQALLQR